MEGIIKGKALYTPKGAALEYGRIGCNFYTGCPHDCTYCYLKRGAPSKQLGGTEVRLKKCFKNEEDAAETLCKELDKHLEQCQQYGIFLSFTTDPLIKETRGLTSKGIYECLRRAIPVYILTKDATFINDRKFMVFLENIKSHYRYSIHFGFTLTGHDDMEPNASSNAERINAMRHISLMGFNTFASIEPVIDWDAAEKVICNSILWCNHYKIGLRSGVKRDYYNAEDSAARLNKIVDIITHYNKTVYIKQSVYTLLKGKENLIKWER